MILKRTLIIGGGEAANYVFHALTSRATSEYQVIGLLDDFSDVKLNKIPRFGGLNQLEEVIQDENIACVLLAIPSLEHTKRKQILDTCISLQIETQVLPTLQDIFAGKEKIAMRPVAYQDIIERDEFELEYQKVARMVKNKTILVTGAGGSIGSEITRQIMRGNPEKLILLGHGEASIYNIHRELKRAYPNVDVLPCIADIQNKERMVAIFEEHRPDIVYHAAAHKHVPLMEENSAEAIANNVRGTWNLAEVANEFFVDKFVMISTDKAVKPSTIMGASKRIAEKVVQLFNQMSQTNFCVVRFGNVLGSRGSVVPLFHDQICNNEPVTLTHPDMERYFMTIPEASKLVIQASMLTVGGEIFVLDMGAPIKILDVIYKLIDLAGRKRDTVSIEFIGIRKGEKVQEELFENHEKKPVQIFDKIFVGVGNPHPTELIGIQMLLDNYMHLTDEERKKQLFELVELDWRYEKI
ncbi:polysaccharide biosynthesis protein [Listeria rocourtiae]|uniref:polysaccharide biosynthesis protein n=1 Tax=Listeria rocourtiae TaxID=647910 RepID=UPI00162A7CA7|nr:nucleoside-diphosphate sugar epimerase/dehydratase [Listeria rocourtiae]MBC1435168.1 polysaccharide biosynthesis protein [Listeria rocourtiae]